MSSITKFKIEVTPETTGLIQTVLFNMGYKWVLGETKPCYMNQTILNVDTLQKVLTHSGEKYPELNIQEFCDWSITGKFPFSEVHINKDYTAIITKNDMKVGFQTVSKEVALKLAKEILRVME